MACSYHIIIIPNPSVPFGVKFLVSQTDVQIRRTDSHMEGWKDKYGMEMGKIHSKHMDGWKEKYEMEMGIIYSNLAARIVIIENEFSIRFQLPVETDYHHRE